MVFAAIGCAATAIIVALSAIVPSTVTAKAFVASLVSETFASKGFSFAKAITAADTAS